MFQNIPKWFLGFTFPSMPVVLLFTFSLLNYTNQFFFSIACLFAFLCISFSQCG